MLSAVRGPPRRENCVAVATALQKPKRAEILVLVLRADRDRGLRADRDRGLLAAHDPAPPAALGPARLAVHDSKR